MNKPMIAVVSALVLAAGSAAATTIVIPGTSDPFLAGASSGNSVTFSSPGNGTDTAPAESPVLFGPVTAGETLSITGVTGTVSNGACCVPVGPAGGAPISSAPFTASGFTALVQGFTNLPINSLVGVFYGPTPSGSVDTVFEIGTGGTFTVPVGATEFFLATVDGYQWSNNTGAFTASVAVVPEPAVWALTLIGFAGLGLALRSRRRLAAATI